MSLPNQLLVLVLFWPLFSLAQFHENEVPTDFFAKLGVRDALYEQSLGTEIKGDLEDMVADQNAYEAGLKEKDLKAYNVYMVSKCQVYLSHDAICNHSCEHNETYKALAAYYLSLKDMVTLAQSKNRPMP